MHRTLLVIVALTGTLVVILADAAKPRNEPKESGPLAVKGEWIDCNTVTESKQDGDNQLITIAITEKFSGTLNGSYEGIERNVVHKDGSGTFHGSGSYSGEINQHSGTAVMTYSGTVDAKGVAHANWILDQGTDALARIDGRGTFEGKESKQRPSNCSDANSQSAWAGAYTGTIDFGDH